jgi:hypothetical protein
VRAFLREVRHRSATPMYADSSSSLLKKEKLDKIHLDFSKVGLAILLLACTLLNVRADSVAALSFDGMDDLLEISSPPVLGSAFTEEAWILPDPKDDRFHGILGSNSSKIETRPPGLWLKDRTKLQAGFGTGDQWVVSVSPPDTIIPNVWNHVAATFDGTTYRLFANGSEVGSKAAKKGPVLQPIRRIGRVDYWFPGAIREVRLWNRALSGEEIRGQMGKKLTGTEPGLIGYFPLDDASGDRAKNLARNGGDATLLNGPTWINSSAQTAPGVLKAHLLEARPGAVQAFSPDGDNVAPDVPIEITLRESAGKVPPDSIRLTVDTTAVEPIITTNDAGGLVIHYEPRDLLQSDTNHTVKLSYLFEGSETATNDFSYDFSVSSNVIISK